MTTDILIVSCAKHFPWLRWALKSIVKFASGFRQVLVMVPKDDLSAMAPLLTEFSGNTGIPIRVKVFEDWPGKGFLRHEHIIMTTDEHTDADFILHTDSDCLFTEPFKPEDYFVNGKPVLLHASYHWLVTTQQANLGMWQIAVQDALGWVPDQETMRRHPAVHYHAIYDAARKCIEAHTKKPCEEYIKGCVNEFPQSFCEFNTLGAVAWKHFHSDYHWHDHEKDGWIKPHKIVQFWSHQAPEIPQAPYYKDQPFSCTPETLLASL